MSPGVERSGPSVTDAPAAEGAARTSATAAAATSPARGERGGAMTPRATLSRSARRGPVRLHVRVEAKAVEDAVSLTGALRRCVHSGDDQHMEVPAGVR